MIAIDGVEMPKNCHECDSFGISDLVGIKCPCENEYCYDFNKRPDGCPLKEVIKGNHEEIRRITMV